MYNFKHKAIILASSSKSRETLLKNAKIDFLVKRPSVDEDSIRESAIAGKTTFQECAILLAEIKGHQIAISNTEAFVIASDQILESKGIGFSKPKSLKKAKEQLRKLQGNTHALHTSAVVFSGGRRIWHHLSSPTVTLRSLTDIEIDDYLKEIGNKALKTPGCYQIENQGCHIISSFNGSFYDILGIPLLPLLEFLRVHGLKSTKETMIL